MKKNSIVVFLLIMMFSLAGCGNITENTQTPATNSNIKSNETATSALSQSNTSTRNLAVSFIDVGQGDAIFLQLPNNQTMLIDAGSNEAGSTVVSYLNNKGIKKIDYLVATHPHEDHIGGIDNVIQNFNIGSIYMPKITTTTKSFEDVLQAIKAKDLKITTGKAGMIIIDQNRLKISFLAPGSTAYEELNNWSIVTRVQYGSNSFLLTGDAEDISEIEMLKTGSDLQADVLKIGHHGSHSSTSPAFLQAVNPKYAVISAGKKNDYGHPHLVTLNKLAATGTIVYRTDLNGTVVISSDGQNLSAQAVDSEINPRPPNNVVTPTTTPAASTTGYIGNKNSKKFHLPSCSSLPAVHNRVEFETRDDAIKAGYVPCKSCCGN